MTKLNQTKSEETTSLEYVNAIITAETGYQLSKSMLGKGNPPTIVDMRKGITVLLPQFSSCFAKAHVLENDTIDWVRGGRANLVEGSYDRMEDRVNYCLEAMPLKSGSLAAFAPKVFTEHDNGYKQHNGTIVVPPLNDNEAEATSFLDAYAANKVVFYGTMCLNICRSIYPDTFNPARNLALSDILALETIEIVSAEDLDEYNDHAAQLDSGKKETEYVLDDAAWDIQPSNFKPISAEGLGFNDAKAQDNAANLRDATMAWLSFATDTEILKLEIEESRLASIKYFDEAEKGSIKSMFTGQNPKVVNSKVSAIK